MSNQAKPRAQFGSRFGVIAAAAGSAIGLGNIWKFPYIMGMNGGGAFLFIYLAFIALIGLPIMLSEFVIGRKSRKNAFGAFKSLAPKTPWKYTGLIGVLAAFIILSFYGVVAGWSIHYVVQATSNNLLNAEAVNYGSIFESFITSPGLPLFYQVLFMIFTAGIVLVGVQKGIEKSSKILMPILLFLIMALVIKSLSLPGSWAGIKFMFKPDFNSVTIDGILQALGHAFFSLSLGMGTLITYGSYIDKQTNLVSTSLSITIADTIIALLAGMAIFPAVFAFNLEPQSGPGLIFVVIPKVFQQMAGGAFFSVLFFLLLTIAALTSAVSMLEVVVVFLREETKMGRKTATILTTVIMTLLGMACSLSFGIWSDFKIFGLIIFDLMDKLASDFMLPIGGMLIAIFVGWRMGRWRVLREVIYGGNLRDGLLKFLIFSLKYIAPFAVLIILLKKVTILDYLLSLF